MATEIYGNVLLVIDTKWSGSESVIIEVTNKIHEHVIVE